MVLGLLDLKAPMIAGGNPQRAVAELEKGLQFGKGNAFLRLHLAEAYEAVGRAADAREQLNAILSMQPDPDYLPELKEAQQSAQQRLDKLEISSSDRNQRPASPFLSQWNRHACQYPRKGNNILDASGIFFIALSLLGEGWVRLRLHRKNRERILTPSPIGRGLG